MPSTAPSIAEPQVLFVEDVQARLRCGERVARQVLHEAGTRIGRRRLAITPDQLKQYLRRRDGKDGTP